MTEISLAFMEISPSIISSAQDTTVNLLFDAKNKGQTEMTTLSISIQNTEAPLFFVEGQDEVLIIEVKIEITNRWKQHVIPLMFRLKNTLTESKAALIKVTAINLSGGSATEKAHVTCRKVQG